MNNKEVSKILGIGDSTLRKWCIELEENGYSFNRTSKNSRNFSNRDIKILKLMKLFVMTENLSLEQSAKNAIEFVTNDSYNKKIDRIIELLEVQNQKFDKLILELRDQNLINKLKK